jgi:acyl-CoA thioester hydrolase
METHETLTRVRYQETDQMGVVYHSNYLHFFEIGRTELMRDRGFPYADLERRGLSLAVVEACCRYRAPARYDDLLRIRTLIRRIRPVRITFEYEIRDDSDGRVLAEGHTEMACVGRDGRPKRLPEPFLERFRTA